MTRFTMFAFLCCFGFLVPNLGAQDFPDEIQDRFDSVDFVLAGSEPIGANVPGFDGSIGTLYQILDLTNGVDSLVLLEYQLGGSSVSDSFGNVSPLSGSIFILGRLDYLERQANQFTLYLEKVTPSVIEGNFEHETVDLEFIDNETLNAGQAKYCFEDQVYPEECGPPVCDGSPNTLLSKNRPLQCIGLCCGVSAQVRLPGVEYCGNPSVLIPLEEFDFSDPDFNLVYEHTSFSTKYESFLSVQRFEIPLLQKGDVNEDGTVNLLDVDEFVDCLSSGKYDYQCDMDCNESVNLLDVPVFIAVLAK